uniref:MFS domain-containing protein n=1 Tax=Meloidogyne hapla TaxID=6305 RepID=A0A1I8BMH9_MELHA
MNLFPPKGRLLQTVLFSFIISFLNLFFQSYSAFYTNTAAANVQKYINDSYIARGQIISKNYLLWFWNFVLNLPFLGFLLSNLLAPYLCEKAGRRGTLLYTNCACFISVVVTVISIIFLIPELFLISRVVGSALTNINFCAFALFVTEYPATKYRGLAVFLGGFNFNFVGNIGMILGMDWLLGKNVVALAGIMLLPAFLAILFIIPLKETPKFLYLKRQDKKATLEALKFYQGDNFDHEEYLHEMEKERQNNDSSPIFQRLKEIFTQKHLFLATILSAAALQLPIGPWPMATTLLSSHFDIEQAQLVATICTFSSLLANIPGTFMSERQNSLEQGWAQETFTKNAKRNARPKFNANNAKRKNAKK